jgi:hypothetical protein
MCAMRENEVVVERFNQHHDQWQKFLSKDYDDIKA